MITKTFFLAEELVPAGVRLRADSGMRLVAGGTVLVGGSPVRVLRLSLIHI